MRSTLALLALAASTGCSPLPEESLAGGVGPADDPTDGQAEWGLLVYAANDDQNTALVRGFGADAEEWARFVGGSKVFRVMVQRDYSPHDEGKTDTERYVLERGQAIDPTTGQPGVQKVGETDTTRRGALLDFLNAGISTLRARHYWLVVTGHGDNWLGLATDASAVSGARLPLADLRDELAAAVTGALHAVRTAGIEGSDRFDVVQFDACRMGSMEVASEQKGVADYLVGSQENEPNDGHPYGAFYSLAQLHLGSSPRTAVAEVVSDYVRSYNQHLSTRPGDYVGTGITSVALDLRKLARLEGDLKRVVDAVRGQRAQGLSCPEIAAVRSALVDAGAELDPEGPIASVGAVDLLALLTHLAGSATFNGTVHRAARRALDTIARPDEMHDPNRRFGFVRSSPDSMPDYSPLVTEGHSLDQRSGLRPHGLSVMLADPQRMLSNAEGTPAMTTYRATAFERATSWTRLVGACEARRQACIDFTGSPFAPDNPCHD